MQVLHYPHPTLRHKSQPIRRVDAQLRRTIREMFELMYEANGVGLAANQVDLPLRLFVLNLQAEQDAPDEERVFINPVISGRKGLDEQEEGCLSLPGVYGQVKRPERVTIQAYDLDGNEIREDVSGLLARVVQHETDHLDGVLFIDRLSSTGKLAVKEALEEFEVAQFGRRERGELPDDEAIGRRLSELQERYCYDAATK